jgi:hypothetical protein
MDNNKNNAAQWQPGYGTRYWYITANDGQFFVSYFHWGNDDVDFINRDAGNCFKTNDDAIQALDKIIKMLKTLSHGN